MPKVSVNDPKTPVTEGSSGLAAATLPNMCKMPGPPAPFVPVPLPNIGKSGTSPKNYSKSVTIGGKKVAIRGATFGSMGDVASKGTGGGLVSSNVEGPTSFVGPGSMNVKFEGKNVQLLGDPMLNNCGPGGNPPNSATLLGVLQTTGFVTAVTGKDACPLCRKGHGALKETKATKVSANQLAEKLARRVRNNEFPKLPLSRMLGVVQCKCDKKYADHSGVTLKGFYESVMELGWHAPKKDDLLTPENKGAPSETQDRVCKFLEHRFNQYDKHVRNIWNKASRLAEKSSRGETSSAAYPPGSCAAPKALVLALTHKAYPAAITEQWFHSESRPTAAKIKFFDAKTGTVVERAFAHGETVPPCGTCELLIPLMLCPGDKKEQCCQH